ncbi:eukaryotic translation initiation factor-related [Striga hermonthica]|uniref:Eukaryotic translation initiation factor-related n=1 Tax=Striga hermonthica TaxID=68872 RepID=A0A9N7ND57_STRHE|nr:eukaryotic translation initiation factor-related [Striga hermonthica]
MTVLQLMVLLSSDSKFVELEVIVYLLLHLHVLLVCHGSLIGCNFDEDERKPLDGLSGTRRPIVDESDMEPKVGSRSVLAAATSYAGSVSEVSNVRPNNPTLSANRSFGLNYPNAWGVGKEDAGIKGSVSAVWSSPDAERPETKLAHASALEKDRVKSTARVDSFERDTSVAADELQPVVPLESSERPRLKLLPRSKPIENVEMPTDYKQTSNQLHVEDSYAVHEPKISLQSGAGGPVVVDRAPERPKLNLMPRSQTTEQLEGNDESKRGTVFGGGRPRELVLKERGIEDDASIYESQSPLRMKATSPDTNNLRKNNQADIDKNSNQRAPSPETWHKPVDLTVPVHFPLVRFGKAASAVELAQAFSEPVPDPTISRGVSGQARARWSFPG